MTHDLLAYCRLKITLRLYRLHVSRPPPPLPSRWIRYRHETFVGDVIIMKKGET